MALLPLQSSYFTNKPHFLLHKTLPIKPKFTIFSQKSSKPTNNDPIEQSSDQKSNPSTGQGFGSGSTQQPKPSSSAGKKKGKKERASIIRRTPVEKPPFLDKRLSGEEANKQTSVNENAFLLTWLGLGIVIFVEGIALASSGFLPEEWDKIFVKYLYPSFTPTVFLFVAGTVVYGVSKYLQNENLSNPK